MIKCHFVSGLVLGIAIVLAPWAAYGQSGGQLSVPSEVSSSNDYHYVLGPSDVIHVEVLNHADFNVKMPIGADGTIQLPYIGSLQAANMTVSALRAKIADELYKDGVFSKVSLEVDVVSYASRYVTVLGGVAAPGLLPVDRTYHVSEILARAGGLRDGNSNYIILRSLGGAARQLSVRDMAIGNDASDPVVAPGDKIYVPTEVFYIKGQVKAPGAYPLSLDMTLAMALARGGGLTDFGNDNRIKITRKNVQLEPGDLNFKVMPEDVIDVGESWF